MCVQCRLWDWLLASSIQVTLGTGWFILRDIKTCDQPRSYANACPPWCVTFDLSHALSWAWQEVKCEAVSVNEADYLC